MKFFKIIFLIPFFMLASCETITDWTESIIPGDDEFVEEGNDNQQLLSDEVEMKDPTLEEILAESMNEDDFEIADEQLSATPAKEYDSVLIDQGEESTIPETTDSQNTELVQEDPSETIDNILKEQAKAKAPENEIFRAPESLVSSLNLKDKIQYRVATINFRSGSSKQTILSCYSAHRFSSYKS